MDLRKIIALTLMIPTLRVYATGAESVENNTTEQEEKINNTTEQEAKILAKMKAILNDPTLKKEVLKSIYEPKGLRDNYDELKKELEAPNSLSMSNYSRAEKINKIIEKIDDPILKAMGRKLLLYSEIKRKVFPQCSKLFDNYKKYLLDYIKMLTMNRGEFPCIPPSVGMNCCEEMKELTTYFNNTIFNNIIDHDVINKSEQMLDQYYMIFCNMWEMKLIAKARVAKQSDANLINPDNCKTLIEAKEMSSDVVKMILNDTYLKELITEEIYRLEIAKIEEIQVASYNKFLEMLSHPSEATGPASSNRKWDVFRISGQNGRLNDRFLSYIARVLAITISSRGNRRDGFGGSMLSETYYQPLASTSDGAKLRLLLKQYLELITQSDQISTKDRQIIDGLKEEIIKSCCKQLDVGDASESNPFTKYRFYDLIKQLENLNNKTKQIINSKG